THPFQVSANFRGDTTHHFQVQATWSGAPLELVSMFRPDLPAIASLTSGFLRYQGKDFWNGIGLTQLVLTTTPGKGLPVEGVLRGEWKGGFFQIQDARFHLKDSRVQLTGNVAPTGVDLSVEADVARWSDLQAFSEKFAQIPGRASLQAHIQGPFDALK